MAEDKNVLQRLRDFLGHVGNIQTLFGLFASFGISSAVISRLPGGWHPPQYWAIFGTAFFGTWLSLKVILHFGYRIHRWHKPSALELSADSGEHGCVGIVHRGSATTVSATGRIIELLDGSPNPSPHRFECLLSRGAQREASRLLGDGEWTQIVLASEASESDSGYPEEDEHTGLRIHRGLTGLSVPDTGALVEIEFTLSAPLSERKTTITKRFTARWVDGRVQMEESS